MDNCKTCGSPRMSAHVVEVCGDCGQEHHDYESLDSLKRQLASYEAAHRRLKELAAPANDDTLLNYEFRVAKSAVREAMLLEHELFPIGGRSES